MSPENSEDAFKTAYAIVGLYSDSVWTLGEPDDFKKANQELWVHYNRVNNFYTKQSEGKIQIHPVSTKKRVRTVRDTIPFSRLAQYGNYEYNEDRERLYTPDYTSPQYTNESHEGFESPDFCEEIWMSTEVEEAFKKLTSLDGQKDQKLLTQESTTFTPFPHEVQKEDEKQTPQQLLIFKSWASIILTKYPKLADSLCNSEQESLFSDNVAELSASHQIEPFDLNEYPTPRYSIRSLEELKLKMRINSPEIKEIWNKAVSPNQFEEHSLPCQRIHAYRHIVGFMENPFNLSQSLAHRPPPPTLNANVPEFFPKVNVNCSAIHKEDNNGQRYFPSAHETNDQNVLFPYINFVDKHKTNAERINNITGIPYTTTLISTGLVGLTTFTTAEATSLQQPRSQEFYTMQYPGPVSVVCRPTQQRFSSNFEEQVSTLVYTHSHASGIFDANTFSQETPVVINKRRVPAPRNIPVYQRPPESYAQNQDLVANGNNACSRRRQGGGVDYSNLILLTQGSKGHNQIQNTIRHQQLKINEIPTESSMTDSQHEQQPSGSALFGRDLFSGLSFRSSSCEGLNKSMQADASNPFEENVHSVKEHSMKNETTTCTRSVHQWLHFNYNEKGNEVQDVNNAIEEFFTMKDEFEEEMVNNKENSGNFTKSDSESNGFLLMEVDSFPPIVPPTPTTVSSSIMTEASSTLQTGIPNQGNSSFNSLLGKMSIASGVNSKRRLYRDVLANMAIGTITSSVTTVVDNCSDPRFEELERQALEQYRPSEENLGQRYQQQRSSEESISQRFQELERQALEQYHCSNSSITEGFVSDPRENDGRFGVSGTDIKNDSGSTSVETSPQQSTCSDMEHCTPTKNASLGGDLTKSPPSKEANSTSHSVNQISGIPSPVWNRGCFSETMTNIMRSNICNKRGTTGPYSTQSHHSLPSGATVSTAGDVTATFIPNNANNQERPVTASKSLSAIGSIPSPIITSAKHVIIPSGATGDKAGDGMHPESPMNLRRLALIAPAKKQHFVPSDINGKEVGPQLMFIAQGIRGGGQNMGSVQGPRRLVTTTFKTSCQASRPPDLSTRAKEAKKNKPCIQEQFQHQHQSIEQNLGGGDENPYSQQQNQENIDQHLFWSQAPEKSHPILKHNNEEQPQRIVMGKETVMGSTDCMKTSEADRHSHQSSEMSSNCTGLHSSSTIDLEQPSCTKPPPWMNKQHKKRSAPRNKKKRNKSSGRKGSFFRKRLRGVSSECDLRFNEHNTSTNRIFNKENGCKKCSYNSISRNELSYEGTSLSHLNPNKEFCFNSNNLIPVIPHDFRIETCPQEYIIDWISNSKLPTTVIILNRTKMQKTLNKNIFEKDECNSKYKDNKTSLSIYMFNPEMMIKVSNIKLQLIIQDFEKPECYNSLTEDLYVYSRVKSLILKSTVNKTESKSSLIAERIKSSIYENLIFAKKLHILKLNSDIALLQGEIKNAIECINKGCNLQSQRIFKNLCDIKITISEFIPTLKLKQPDDDTSVKQMLEEERNIIFSKLNVVSSCNQPSEQEKIIPLSLARQSFSYEKGKHKKKKQQTQMYELLQRNVSTQCPDEKCPKLQKCDTEFQTHIYDILEHSKHTENKGDKCFSKNKIEVLDLFEDAQYDLPNAFPSKAKNSENLPKQNKAKETHLENELCKSNNVHEDESHFNESSILSDEKIKNSTVICYLRQNISKTTKLIQSVCEKWKKNKQNEECEMEFQDKIKQDSKCTVQ